MIRLCIIRSSFQVHWDQLLINTQPHELPQTFALIKLFWLTTTLLPFPFKWFCIHCVCNHPFSYKYVFLSILSAVIKLTKDKKQCCYLEKKFKLKVCSRQCLVATLHLCMRFFNVVFFSKCKPFNLITG